MSEVEGAFKLRRLRNVRPLSALISATARNILIWPLGSVLESDMHGSSSCYQSQLPVPIIGILLLASMIVSSIGGPCIAVYSLLGLQMLYVYGCIPVANLNLQNLFDVQPRCSMLAAVSLGVSLELTGHRWRYWILTGSSQIATDRDLSKFDELTKKLLKKPSLTQWTRVAPTDLIQPPSPQACRTALGLFQCAQFRIALISELLRVYTVVFGHRQAHNAQSHDLAILPRRRMLRPATTSIR
jgi:hypothetical protein